MIDGNEWTTEGRNILSPNRLAALRNELENVGPVIMEHWFYYGSRSPDRIVFEEYQDIEKYLSEQVRPGDALYFWSFAKTCCDHNTLVDGKIPDKQGRTPKGGAY